MVLKHISGLLSLFFCFSDTYWFRRRTASLNTVGYAIALFAVCGHGVGEVRSFPGKLDCDLIFIAAGLSLHRYLSIFLLIVDLISQCFIEWHLVSSRDW